MSPSALLVSWLVVGSVINTCCKGAKSHLHASIGALVGT